MTWIANSSRGQLKIQQMAFVLMAIIFFFALVAILYLIISLGNLKEKAASLQEDEAKELVRKLASTPEFASSACSNCIDLDKVFILKSRNSYKGFWNLDFLQIEKVFPTSKGECEKSNYPQCSKITLIPKEEFGSPSNAFVSLCYFEQQQGGYVKCELGRIYASGKNLK